MPTARSIADKVLINEDALTKRVTTMSATNVDAQNNTITAAQIAGGLVVHTSVTGAGTATSDTAANLVAALLGANDDCVACYYVNDGDQTVTFAGGTGVTVADAGQTVAENESAILIFRRTSATAVSLYVFGA